MDLRGRLEVGGGSFIRIFESFEILCFNCRVERDLSDVRVSLAG